MGTITIGAGSYEIHGTLAGAKTYFAAHVEGSTFLDATALNQKKWLVTAARRLDRYENNPTARWTGSKTVSTQETSWPRDNATCNGVAVTSGTTPDDIITGEYELALEIGKEGAEQSSLTEGSLVKRAKGGSAEVEFFGPTRGGADDTPLPARVWQLVGCYFEGQTTSVTVAGNTTTSSFETSAGLTRGFA